MSCSARISRIIPTALPLTLESIPSDFQSLPPPATPFANATLIRNENTNGSQILGSPNEWRSPISPVLEIPSRLPPTSSLRILSWKGQRFNFRTSITSNERYTCQASQQRCKDPRSAKSRHSTQKRNGFAGIASPTPPSGRCPQQHPLTGSNSAPASTSSLDKSRWMMVATSVHMRHDGQNEQLLPARTDDNKTRRHRYSHVVRTDALVPSRAQETDSYSSEPCANQRQPWLTENHEIDWAQYFMTQPLPTSAEWSRLEATVHSVDWFWTGSAKVLSP